jgi:transcriptional regulator GlxA family with amidase domain
MKNSRQVTLLLFFIAWGLNGFSQGRTAFYCPPCGNDCDTTAYASPGTCAHCGMTLIEERIEAHDKNAASKHLSVLFYLQDGVEALDFAGPLEVFSYAGFDVVTVAKTKDRITSQGVLKITPDYSIKDAPKADIVAFFGGSTGKEAHDPEVIAWVKEQQPQYFFSVCTGAFFIGNAGLLDNQMATTFHLSIEDLRKSFPKTKVLAGVRFIDNGRIITTAGISAGIDGALHLVAKIHGEAEAKRIAAHLEYDKWVPNAGLVIDAKTR